MIMYILICAFIDLFLYTLLQQQYVHILYALSLILPLVNAPQAFVALSIFLAACIALIHGSFVETIALLSLSGTLLYWLHRRLIPSISVYAGLIACLLVAETLFLGYNWTIIKIIANIIIIFILLSYYDKKNTCLRGR